MGKSLTISDRDGHQSVLRLDRDFQQCILLYSGGEKDSPIDPREIKAHLTVAEPVMI